ncbi:MAG: PAS domain-containing sensor histidine kinase [Chthoniobacteraceae bacterium]|jgi:PAS domain S-box-containing protein
MTTTTHKSFPNHFEVNDMALSLAQAEDALRSLTSDQVDAVVGADGKTYLLRPAQEHLLQNGRRLNAVMESVPDVITVVNRGGTIISQSPLVTRVLGYEPEELVGTSIFTLIREEDLPEAHSAFFNVVEGFEGHATVQFNHRSRDGSYSLIEATLGKLQDSDPPSVVFSLRPISRTSREGIEIEKREAESALASLPKDRFLAMLAHELRTPLMPVLLCVGEMQEDKRFAEAAPMLAIMRRNIELQARLLEELSDFTSVGQHKVRLRPEPIDVHEAVRFVMEICRSEIAAAGIEVKLDLRASNNIVLADSLRLQQVMWNLLKNAVKFSPPGGSISISSENEAPGDVTLLFVDHGIGIEPELLPLVFDPFKQSDRIVNRQNYGGLGLGMFIAKGLTEAQEGSLIVTSEGLGFGTTFCLTLKLAPPAGIAQAIPPCIEFGPTTS